MFLEQFGGYNNDMRKTIFELENKLNIDDEFHRICNIIFNDSYSVSFYNHRYSSFIDAVNQDFFSSWPYRDTFIDIYDYLDFIGIDQNIIGGFDEIDEKSFLYFLEFLANIANFISNKIESERAKYDIDKRVMACISNIKTVLAKMHCELKKDGDKVYIAKRNADVDSVIRTIPEDIADLLLAYCDFRIESNIEAKKTILKKIDIYIDANKKQLDSYDGVPAIRNDMDFIMNKLGINHATHERLSNLSKDELLDLYDSCFTLALDILRKRRVSDIRKRIIELKESIK